MKRFTPCILLLCSLALANSNQRPHIPNSFICQISEINETVCDAHGNCYNKPPISGKEVINTPLAKINGRDISKDLDILGNSLTLNVHTSYNVTEEGGTYGPPEYGIDVGILNNKTGIEMKKSLHHVLKNSLDFEIKETANDSSTSRILFTTTCSLQ